MTEGVRDVTRLHTFFFAAGGRFTIVDPIAKIHASPAHLRDYFFLSSLVNFEDMHGFVTVVPAGFPAWGRHSFFAIKNYAQNKDLMHRARRASPWEEVEYRMCRAVAQLQGLKPEDIQGFVKMVPMG